MALMNTPTSVDTYVLPADAAPAKAAAIALIDGAAAKIRIAMYTFTDADLVAAILRANTRGVTDIMIALDYHQAHMHWSQMALHGLRNVLTPAKMVYTLSPMKNMPMHRKLASVDDTATIDGSTNWTKEGWEEAQSFEIVTNPTLAAMNSAIVDALAAWGLAHLSQV